MKLQTLSITGAVEPVGADRRRAPRLPVSGRIHAESTTLAIPFALSDLSRTGFSVQSAVAFPTGIAHNFRFITTAGLEILIQARSVHVSAVDAPDGPYRTGFEFLTTNDPSAGRAVEQLLAHLRVPAPAVVPAVN